jgi:HK97 family phage major capsid protein
MATRSATLAGPPSTAAGAGVPPGAVLDKYEWAQSWSRFLAALHDPHDRLGVRPVIRDAAQGMSERIPSEGGFLVPWVLTEQVLNYTAAAIVRPRASIVPMSTLQQAVPTLSAFDEADGSQALGGMTFSVVEEGSAIPATAPAFDRLQLEARKYAGYLQNVPAELLSDAAGAMGDLLGRIIATGYGWWEDELFLTGTGVGQPQGLINAPGALAVDRASEGAVGLADVAAMMEALHPAAERGAACWLVTSQVFDSFLTLSLGVGESPSATYVPASEWLKFDSAAGCWRLIGLPCFPHDHNPALGDTGDAILCDLGQYLIGSLLALTVELSAAGAGFGSDTVNIRVRARIDGRFWPQSTFTTAAGAVVSPLVVLSAST